MNNINVGMGEIQISKAPGAVLVAPGLGSCIGITMYDSIAKIGGMVHVMLPDSNINKNIASPGKFADTAVPEMLNKMLQLGAQKHNIVVKMAGGAQMFATEKGSNILNIGIRNTIAIKAALTKEGLRLAASETGGNKGKTLRLEMLTGKVYLRIIGQQEVEL